jgi:quercetin 2,3-dioxygenase
MRKVIRIQRGSELHWVGDGFPVRTVFSYQTLGADISPFLLLDYASSTEFPPTDKPHGVGTHPHRGFETVTIVYQGELEHRDSIGNHGSIGPGDVQWMTAGSGILHEEMHSREFAKHGGTLEMAQLWVNLPAKFKMSPPSYQTILDNQIPSIPLAEEGGMVRVIAGDFQGVKGPARTFTAINLWDVRLKAGHRINLSLPNGHTTALLVSKGKALLNSEEVSGEAELVLFDREGESITIEARRDLTALLMNGEPIDEPIAGYGPFVMNTEAEIRQAISDYQSGRLGNISSSKFT